MKQFLHVGCGAKSDYDTEIINATGFRTKDWREIRLDIDPSVHPDIVGSMTSMPLVESQSMDAIFSRHNLEHLYAHEVKIALSEFKRVLKPDGFAIISCPDIQAIAEYIENDKLTDVMYTAPGGHPISALDFIFGWGFGIEHGRTYMAHKTAFTLTTLNKCLSDAGFSTSASLRKDMELLAVATVSHAPPEQLGELSYKYFPIAGKPEYA